MDVMTTDDQQYLQFRVDVAENTKSIAAAILLGWLEKDSRGRGFASFEKKKFLLEHKYISHRALMTAMHQLLQRGYIKQSDEKDVFILLEEKSVAKNSLLHDLLCTTK